MSKLSLESMIDLSLNQLEYSEEAYFGLSSPFSSEMINHAKLLREEVKRLLGGDWKDENKRSIILKEELVKDESVSKLVNILENMGKCVATHCNIEKCYIGLFNDINAYTMPIVFDSGILLDGDKNPIIRRNGENYVNGAAIRSNADIQSLLLKIEDVAINKNGYRFKDKKGKIFIINIGIPIVVDEIFESTPEDICAILFHEIGHNFQQILHGANQMIVDYFVQAHLKHIANNKFYNVFGFLESFLVSSSLKNILAGIKVSNQFRFSIIKTLLFSSVLVNRDGTLVTREDIGEFERENLVKVVEIAKQFGTLPQLSTFTRVWSTINKTFMKVIQLAFLPLEGIHTLILRNDLDKNYKEVIKHNKSYEQFADTFAVAYGFGGNSAKFYIEVQKYVKNMKQPSYLSILNHIPIISTIDAMNTVNIRRMKTHVNGYDQEYVRIAQAYRALEYEVAMNPGLTPQQRKEIGIHMTMLKEDFDTFNKLEMENFSTNKSLSKWIMKKYRSGDIRSIANESGIVEGVFEVINEYEKVGKTKQPPIVEVYIPVMNSGDSKRVNSTKEILLTGIQSLASNLDIFKRLPNFDK